MNTIANGQENRNAQKESRHYNKLVSGKIREGLGNRTRRDYHSANDGKDDLQWDCAQVTSASKNLTEDDFSAIAMRS
jgi:hypothetical protein